MNNMLTKKGLLHQRIMLRIITIKTKIKSIMIHGIYLIL